MNTEILVVSCWLAAGLVGFCLMFVADLMGPYHGSYWSRPYQRTFVVCFLLGPFGFMIGLAALCIFIKKLFNSAQMSQGGKK